MSPPPTNRLSQGKGFSQRVSSAFLSPDGGRSAAQRVRRPTVTFISIFFITHPYFSSVLLAFFHFFSSVSAITSICYLLPPVLSLLLTHFSFLPSLSWVSRGGALLSEKFSRPPYPLIFHQPLSNIPCTHTHLLQSIHAAPPSLSLSDRGTNAFVQYLQQTD